MNNIHIDPALSWESQPTLIADQYELKKLIADSTLGKFFRARDLMSLDPESMVIMVAVEEKISNLPGFDKTLPRVLEEFSHPHAPVHVTDACHSAGFYWLVFQAEDGEMLSEHIHNNSVPMLPETVQPLMVSLLRAVKQIMPQGGFGFLEPEAVFCTGETCKLLNAPLAIILRVLSRLSVTEEEKTVLYSGYISPEIACGLPATPQDDTFSLSCITYHLLNGSPPFGTFSTLEASAKKMTTSQPANLDIETWKSLQRGLSLQRMTRQISPYELLHAFTSAPTDSEEKQPGVPTMSISLKAAMLAGIGLLSTYVLGQFFYSHMTQNPLPEPMVRQVANPATIITPTKLAAPPAPLVEPVATLIQPNEKAIVRNITVEKTFNHLEKDLKPIKKEQQIASTAIMETSSLPQPKEATYLIVNKKTIEKAKVLPSPIAQATAPSVQPEPVVTPRPPVQAKTQQTPPPTTHRPVAIETTTVTSVEQNTFIVTAIPNTPKPAQQSHPLPTNNAFSRKVAPQGDNTFIVVSE
jgi:serine/threonine protein kinase